MKANVSRGGSFANAVNYLSEPDNPEREIIGGNVEGSVDEIVAQFEECDQIEVRGNVRQKVWRVSLSLTAQESLSNEKWTDVARDFMSHVGMGDGHKYVVAKHTDTDNEHIHITASRVSDEGKVWHGVYDAQTAIKAAAKIERDHGLEVTKTLGDPGESSRTAGTPELRMKLANDIDAAIAAGDGTVHTLSDTLETKGVSMRVARSDSIIIGLSFERDGTVYKGSRIGRNHSWPALSKRLNDKRTSTGHDPLYEADEVGPRKKNVLTGSDASEKPSDISKWYERIRANNTVINDGIASMRPHNKAAQIKLKTHETLIDTGGRLELRGEGGKDDITFMIEVAKARVWESVKLTGSATFRVATAVALTRAGLQISSAPQNATLDHTLETAERWQRANQTNPSSYLTKRGYTVKRLSDESITATRGGKELTANWNKERQQWFIQRGETTSSMMRFVMEEEGIVGTPVATRNKASRRLSSQQIKEIYAVQKQPEVEIG